MASVNSDIDSGLSLCIQGTLVPYYLYLVPERFIPVYTGNSALTFSTSTIYPVYPCVYRELLQY